MLYFVVVAERLRPVRCYYIVVEDSARGKTLQYRRMQGSIVVDVTMLCFPPEAESLPDSAEPLTALVVLRAVR